jgi:hypothetical protein
MIKVPGPPPGKKRVRIHKHKDDLSEEIIAFRGAV